jgi:hypothetical protein
MTGAFQTPLRPRHTGELRPEPLFVLAWCTLRGDRGGERCAGRNAYSRCGA